MNCEMCGQEASKLITIETEGSKMKVCPDCAKFGKEIIIKHEPKIQPNVRRGLQKRSNRIQERDIFIEAGKEELVYDYQKRIRKARNSLGLTQEQLGKKINEKKSIIIKLESGHIRPDDKTLRKLERALDIVLIEMVKTEKVQTQHSRGHFTIGDLIKK